MHTNLLFKDRIEHLSTLSDALPEFIRPTVFEQANNTLVPSEQKNIVRFDQTSKSRKKERELEWWLGRVIEIHDEYFTAVLEDLAGRSNIVEFERHVIPPDEKDLLFIGSTFTYSISVIDDPIGGRKHETKMAFSARRRWLQEYEKKAKELAEEAFPERLLNL